MWIKTYTLSFVAAVVLAATPCSPLLAQDEREQGKEREARNYAVFIQIGSALLPCEREIGPSLGLESNVQIGRRLYMSGALNAAYMNKTFVLPDITIDQSTEFTNRERCFTADLSWGYNFLRPGAQQRLIFGGGVSGALIRYEYVPAITFLATGERILANAERLNFLVGYYHVQTSYDWTVTPHIRAGAKAMYRFSFDELPEIKRTETRFGGGGTLQSWWSNAPITMWELSLRLGFVF